MKHIKIIGLIMFASLFLVSFQIPRDAKYYLSKGFQVFQQYNLAIKTPTKLEDIADKVKGNFDFCYGCFENKESKTDFAFYQIMINNLPTGFINASPERKKEFEEKFLYNTFQGEQKKVVFNGLNACVVSYKYQNYNGKVLLFLKGSNTFVFNLMGNEIEGRFNALTNNIVFYTK